MNVAGLKVCLKPGSYAFRLKVENLLGSNKEQCHAVIAEAAGAGEMAVDVVFV